MEINHYFDPVNFEKFESKDPSGWKYSLGSVIKKHTLKLREGKAKNVEVALIGLPFESVEGACVTTGVSDEIREQVYALASLGRFTIVDFGNLKEASSYKGAYLALRDIVDYLSELDIVSVVIGGSQDFSYGICQAFRNNPFFSFCSIDAFLDVKKVKESTNASNYLSRIFSQQSVFQFSLLGYQSHYVANELFSKTKGINNHIRLGRLRQDIAAADSVFRNSDFLSFDFSAIKFSETNSEKHIPNGLYAEEACQLAKFAGRSNRLKCFGLFNVDSGEASDLSTKLAAQLIWYFLEGIIQRDHKKPENGDGFSVNKVEIAELSSPLVFLKNEETLQWWIQIPLLNKKMMFFACSEKDYLDATNNEIPGFWLKCIQKTDEILK